MASFLDCRHRKATRAETTPAATVTTNRRRRRSKSAPSWPRRWRRWRRGAARAPTNCSRARPASTARAALCAARCFSPCASSSNRCPSLHCFHPTAVNQRYLPSISPSFQVPAAVDFFRTSFFLCLRRCGLMNATLCVWFFRRAPRATWTCSAWCASCARSAPSWSTTGRSTPSSTTRWPTICEPIRPVYPPHLDGPSLLLFLHRLLLLPLFPSRSSPPHSSPSPSPLPLIVNEVPARYPTCQVQFSSLPSSCPHLHPPNLVASGIELSL